VLFCSMAKSIPRFSLALYLALLLVCFLFRCSNSTKWATIHVPLLTYTQCMIRLTAKLFDLCRISNRPSFDIDSALNFLRSSINTNEQTFFFHEISIGQRSNCNAKTIYLKSRGNIVISHVEFYATRLQAYKVEFGGDRYYWAKKQDQSRQQLGWSNHV